MTSETINGWPVVSLGTLLTDIQPGFASGKHNSTGDGIPHFRPMNVSIDGRIDRTVLKYVDPSAGRAELRLHRGDVVFNNTNSPELVGKTALFEDGDMPAFSNHMTRLRSDPDRLDPGYLALRLHQAWREGWFAAHCNNHVSQASIGREVLKAFEIELPPVAAQRAITNLYHKFDASRAVANTHLVIGRRTINQFRRAVLASACDGRLTATWREHNVSSDMNRILEERASEGMRKTRRGVVPGAPLKPLVADMDLPGTWARITVSRALVLGALGDVKDGNHGANHPKVSEFTAEGLPFIAANLVHDGVIDYDAAPHVSGKALERMRIGFAIANDVILTHKGSVGRVAISDRDCVLTPQTTYYRCETSLILPAYLAIYLESLYFYLQLAEEMSQTTRDFVPISDQYLLGIILPPPQEQLEIVKRVKSLLALTDNVNQRINLTLRRVERSSQALLAKAFRGELVASKANMALSSDVAS